MIYSLYRIARRIPGVASLANSLLRIARNWFWSLRPVSSSSTGIPPEDYIAFVQSEISEDRFTLVEVGAGDGRVLRRLASSFPHASFVGVDIQKAAVAEGNRVNREQGFGNISLVCVSCLDDTIDWNCDYLISRTALIYLNRKEMESFLAKRLPQVRRKLLLQEIVSLTGKTEVSHFFAHPMEELIKAGPFKANTVLLPYEPWKGELWSGANVTFSRVR